VAAAGSIADRTVGGTLLAGAAEAKIEVAHGIFDANETFNAQPASPTHGHVADPQVVATIEIEYLGVA